MQYVVCIIPVCPMRSEASHRSEQVSQLLFGETGEVIERTKDFIKVKCLYDNYEGWCQGSQLAEIKEEQARRKQNILTTDWSNIVTINKLPVHLPFGSSLSIFSGGNFSCKNFEASFEGKVWKVEDNLVAEETIKVLTSKYLNTSYMWGGKSVYGVDCSGFCQVVFKYMNIPLLRDASQQAKQGEVVGFLQETKAGDLAFFDNEEGNITHVGILLDPTKIIHASGKVRIDTIDSEGILNSETGERTHKLRLIKRITS